MKANSQYPYLPKYLSNSQATLSPVCLSTTTVSESPPLFSELSSNMPSPVATPEPQTPGFLQPQTTTAEFSPIIINISYILRNPIDGFEFVLPNDSHPFVSSLSRHGIND